MKCRAIPYEGQEPYLFLSYCHANEESLYPLFEQFSLEGFRIWYDDGNHGGDDWLINIENHVEKCQAMIAFISEASGMSHNCRAEVVYASQLKKTIIPIHIDNAQLPKGLRMQLSHMHALKRSDFSSDKALMNKILETDAVKPCHTGRPIALSTQNHNPPKPDPAPDVPEDPWSKWNAKPAPDVSKKPAPQPKPEPTPQPDPVIIPEPVPEPNVPSKKTRVIKVHPKKNPATVSVKPSPAPDKAPDPAPDPGKTHYEPLPPDPEKTHYEPPRQSEPDEEKTIYGTPAPWTADEDDDGDRTVIMDRVLQAALLVHLSGNKAYVMTGPQTKLGRSPFRCDVVIEDNPSISKYHADIIREGRRSSKFFLRDAGSANGTFVADRKLEAGEKTALENPMLFRLYNEEFLIFDGPGLGNILEEHSVSLLLNQSKTACRVQGQEDLLLNRYHPWEDGTLSDKKISRESHARITREEDGFHLVDESPEYGNGTFLNKTRLKHGQSKVLSSGDCIRLGDTMLEYVTITF